MWMNFVNEYELSWCNWSLTDKDETSSALKPGSDVTGGWENIDLTPSGLFIRKEIRDNNSAIFEIIEN